MKVFLILIAVAAALYALDRFLLYCESRGWIYWRKKNSSPGTVGSAFLEVHSLLEPSKKHVLVIQKEQHHEEDDEGDPPAPPGDPAASTTGTDPDEP